MTLKNQSGWVGKEKRKKMRGKMKGKNEGE